MIELLLQAERALSVGMLDQAERLYRQATDADPRNSIAVVGLARVTLERGDDEGAYLLARRALSIDPDNAAAQRLADRLVEVMTHRGDAVPEMPASGHATSPAVREGPSADATAVQPVTGDTDASATRPEPAPTKGPGLLGRLFRRRT